MTAVTAARCDAPVRVRQAGGVGGIDERIVKIREEIPTSHTENHLPKYAYFRWRRADYDVGY